MASSERDKVTKNEWIYNNKSNQDKVLAPNETRVWEFTFKAIETKEEFYENSLQ